MAFYEEFERLKIQLEEIKSATDNFAENKVIGYGGFGKVYKGEISHSKGKSMAAFKRLDSRFGQGNAEFWKEIMMLSRYRHENLVSLLGYCDEGGENILVYEHAFHGSLDRHLHATTLTWRQRLTICIEVAKGLSYLHDPKGTQQRVLHRDIKSANILLDENWNAKLSDFGLSKIGPANQQHTALISNFVGTLGYCDPLYLETYLLTKESDVYSFGVVLFEVLIGRLCFKFSNGQIGYFVQKWKQSYEENKLDEIIIHELFQQMDPISLRTFSDIAYKCLKRSREDRPKTSDVVTQLEVALESQKAFEEGMDYEVMIKTAVPPLIYRGKTVEHGALENDKVDMESKSDADTDWEQNLPNDYEQIIKLSKDNVQWTTKQELYFLLCRGFLINNDGEEWFSLTKNGMKCYMLPARAALVESEWTWRSLSESRFREVAYNPVKEIHIKYVNKFKMWSSQPQTEYASYLVYKLPEEHSRLEVPVTVRDNRSPTTTWTIYLLCHQTSIIKPMVDQNKHNRLGTTETTYFPQLRSDGWMEVKVWNFRAHYSWRHVDLTLYFPNPLEGLIVQGIQFKPYGSSFL